MCLPWGVVSYCGDPQKAVREMARVLKSGAELLVDGIHSRFGSMRYAARVGDLEALEGLTHSSDAPRHTPVLLPEELEELAHQAGLTNVRVGSEFIFEPDNEIRIKHSWPSYSIRCARICACLSSNVCGDRACSLAGRALF